MADDAQAYAVGPVAYRSGQAAYGPEGAEAGIVSRMRRTNQLDDERMMRLAPPADSNMPILYSLPPKASSANS
jgi:hypothetical protein